MYTYFNKGCFGNCALVFESHLFGGHSSKALHFIMRFNDQISSYIAYSLSPFTRHTFNSPLHERYIIFLF